MSRPRENLFSLIEPFLGRVERPSRYLNHEWGAIEEQDGPFHACLIYADVYEVGQPNLGLSILYNELNAADGISCERAYLPWVDMLELMRMHDVPLLSLETSSPVASFDMVGFTLAHELVCTNIIETLDVAEIPVQAVDRAQDDPIVVAGGPSVWNCEPVAPMFDAVLLGDGEGAIVEIAQCIRDARVAGLSREEILVALSLVDGVYVPPLYHMVHGGGGTRWGYVVPNEGANAPSIVRKRCIPDLSATDPIAQRETRSRTGIVG